MKPVDQTRFGEPGGNCFQASLASILELPLEAVPDFCNLGEDDWESGLNEWLNAFGLFAMHVDVTASGRELLRWFTDNAVALASVNSITTPGSLHSVVFYKDRVIHDPHPSRAHTESEPLSFDAFVVVDPAKARRAYVAWERRQIELTPR